MIKELDCVVLVDEEPKHGLAAGDIGTVVHVYPDAVAYEVEFVTFTGRTAALVTLEAKMIRPVASDEIPHVRQLAS